MCSLRKDKKITTLYKLNENQGAGVLWGNSAWIMPNEDRIRAATPAR